MMEKGNNPEYYPSKPKSIQNVYFAGQHLRSPGGLSVAAESGRRAVQYLCRDTDTVFQGNIDQCNKGALYSGNSQNFKKFIKELENRKMEIIYLNQILI